jgi:hypothetical protein
MSQRVGESREAFLTREREPARERMRRRRAANPGAQRARQREYIRQYRGDNPERRREYSRQYRAAHPEVARDKRRRFLLRLYGITPADYDQLLAAQNGGCAICGEAPAAGKRLVVDHDHKTGRVRGLLCDKHNRALGALNDDPALVLAALYHLLYPVADSVLALTERAA